MKCNACQGMKAFADTLRFILSHPLNRQAKLSAVGRYVAWQIGSRMVPGAVAVRFVNDALLLVRPGMLGATRNIYGGLEEFEEMSFLLHMLRSTDLFVDVGANVGAYTVLASRTAGARSIAFEPAPETFGHLLDNIALNKIAQKTTARNIAIGREPGRLRFTRYLDVMNHIITPGPSGPVNSMEVSVDTLDRALSGEKPCLIKIDVEGYESEVIAGAAATLCADGLLGVIMELNDSGERYGFDQGRLKQVLADSGFTPFAYRPFDRTLSPAAMETRRSRNVIFLRSLDRVLDRLNSAPPFHVKGMEI